MDIERLKREIEGFIKHGLDNLKTMGQSTGESKREEELKRRNKQLESSLEEIKINMEEFEHRHGNEIRVLKMKLSCYEPGEMGGQI